MEVVGINNKYDSIKYSDNSMATVCKVFNLHTLHGNNQSCPHNRS